ncbi:MAG: HPr family phosphocarrier protein [Candidatus Omnitrophica bacterium]|nr:HPr family phosphocarrier protein [Candidatus Omnitrophota bacterium]
MPLLQRTVTVVHQQGLHARPAALFVQAAKQSSSRITVKKGRKIVDGRSIMGLLTLAAGPGSRIAIIADGPDAADVLERLIALVTKPVADPEQKPFHHTR